MNYHLISAIIKGVWAINQESALGYAPLLNNLIGNSPVAFEFDEEQFKPLSIERSSAKHSYYNGWDKAPKGSIAIIPLSGPLMKNDQYCGPIGMATVGQIIKEADEAHNIDGILLKVDSPGGTVDGTAALAEIVANTKKPIIAFADGLMASAALWVGAAADEIIASNNRTEIGSVGVLCSFADMQPAYEKLGVKFHSIVADQSKDKTKMWEDMRKGKYDDYKKEVLNPLANDFIAHMKSARPNLTDDQLTGKVFFAQDVTGSLVDSIGNIDHAIARLTEMIDENENANTNQNSISMERQFMNVNQVLGVESLEASEEGVFLNEDQLEALDTALTPGEEAVEETAEEVEAVVETPEAATEPDPRDARIVELEAQVAAFEAAPAADADPAKENDSKPAGSNDNFLNDVAEAKKMQEKFAHIN